MIFFDNKDIIEPGDLSYLLCYIKSEEIVKKIYEAGKIDLLKHNNYDLSMIFNKTKKLNLAIYLLENDLIELNDENENESQELNKRIRKIIKIVNLGKDCGDILSKLNHDLSLKEKLLILLKIHRDIYEEIND